MISEISQNLAGLVGPQPKGDSGSTSQVQGSSSVVEVKTAPLPGQGKVLDPETVKQEPVTEQELEEVVENLNEFAQSVKRQLQFSVDEDSGKTIIRVVDAETGETIRDIPPEEILNMQKQLRETSEKLFGSGEAGISLLFQGKA